MSRTTKLWLLLSLVKLGEAAYELPYIFDFANFAFGDVGANLTSQYLMGIGLAPYADFTHQYGLLPLIFGRAWFQIWGLSPLSCVAAMAALTVVMLWGLARFSDALRIEGAGACFLVCALPHMGGVLYPNLSYALEAVLLTHAVAFHAKEEKAKALAMATCGIFVKPSMAYFYGLLLLALIARDACALPGRVRVKAFLRAMAPAAAVLIALCAGLTAYYGFSALFHSLFMVPFQGRAAYRFYHSGFFDLGGRLFICPPGARAGYYLGTIAGLWLAGTAFLLGAASTGGIRAFRSAGSRAHEIAATCALLHVVFIFVLFAGPYTSWYYFYLLVMGVVASAGGGKRWSPMLLLFSFMAVLGYTARGKTFLKDWRTKERGALTAGLWSDPGLIVEWRRALDLAKGEKAVLLSYAGCGDLLFAEFAKPVSNYLHRGWARPADLERKAEQLAEASLVVDVAPMDDVTRRSPISGWPEFKGALTALDRIWEGKHFTIYRRSGESKKRVN